MPDKKEFPVECRGLKKRFQNGQETIEVLKGIDLQIKPGEFVAVMGRSGAGKSTLLYQLSLLDEPSEGEVRLIGQDVTKLSAKEATAFRLEHLGYVFQDYALIPELTAAENASLPSLMQGISRSESLKRAKQALKEVELSGKENSLPSMLSGGEKQRVSIARAIAHQPEILFADEPTANLDAKTADKVMEMFKKLHENGQTIIMVTHEEDYDSLFDRILKLNNGQL